MRDNLELCKRIVRKTRATDQIMHNEYVPFQYGYSHAQANAHRPFIGVEQNAGMLPAFRTPHLFQNQIDLAGAVLGHNNQINIHDQFARQQLAQSLLRQQHPMPHVSMFSDPMELKSQDEAAAPNESSTTTTQP